MFRFVALIGVLIIAVLLALDTKRRTERIAYWRVVVTLALALLVVILRPSQGFLYTLEDAGEFLAAFTGAICVLWFLIMRPKKIADKLFSRGVRLLRKDTNDQALTAFNQALEKAKSDGEKARILYNIAICRLRLGDKDAAINSLADAIRVMPALQSAVQKDRDLAGLSQDEQFHVTVLKG